MTDLEQRLQLLAAELEWPATPALELPALPERGRRRLSRPLLVAFAVLVLAAGVAALVPGARSAVLHWFRIGGASVERVQTLPPAEKRALAAGLGRSVGRGGAPLVMKKLAGASTNVQFVDVVPNAMGIWISGLPHVVIFPAAPPRLAGNVLLWATAGLTYRLEGARLEKQDALDLARR